MCIKVGINKGIILRCTAYQISGLFQAVLIIIRETKNIATIRMILYSITSSFVSHDFIL